MARRAKRARRKFRASVADLWLPFVRSFYLSAGMVRERYGWSERTMRRRRDRDALPLPPPIIYDADRPVWMIFHLVEWERDCRRAREAKSAKVMKQ